MPFGRHLASRKRSGAKEPVQLSLEPVGGHLLLLTVCAVYKRRNRGRRWKSGSVGENVVWYGSLHLIALWYAHADNLRYLVLGRLPEGRSAKG